MWLRSTCLLMPRLLQSRKRSGTKFHANMAVRPVSVCYDLQIGFLTTSIKCRKNISCGHLITACWIKIMAKTSESPANHGSIKTQVLVALAGREHSPLMAPSVYCICLCFSIIWIIWFWRWNYLDLSSVSQDQPGTVSGWLRHQWGWWIYNILDRIHLSHWCHCCWTCIVYSPQQNWTTLDLDCHGDSNALWIHFPDNLEISRQHCFFADWSFSNWYANNKPLQMLSLIWFFKKASVEQHTICLVLSTLARLPSQEFGVLLLLSPNLWLLLEARLSMAGTSMALSVGLVFQGSALQFQVITNLSQIHYH